MLVGAHLRAPHPERAADQAGVGPRRRLDLDVGQAFGGRRTVAARQHLDALGFVALAVAVLGEQHHAARRGRRGRSKGVAHQPASSVLAIRSRVNGRSRSRTPRAWATALPIAAIAGPSETSPVPEERWPWAMISATSTGGISSKRRIG